MNGSSSSAGGSDDATVVGPNTAPSAGTAAATPRAIGSLKIEEGRAAQRASSSEPELRARIAALEEERWRTFEDAQREADRVFAQYQLSQLLASGGELVPMAKAVLEELLRHSGASAAALWLSAPGERALGLVAAVADQPIADQPIADRPIADRRIAEAPSQIETPSQPVTARAPAEPPARFVDAAAAAAWSRRRGWSGVTLEESRDLGDLGFEQRGVGFVALSPAPSAALDPEHARFLALIRHELAIAFRAAQLRETLDRERSVLSAILDGASDGILAVDAERRVVKANRAAGALLGSRVAAVGVHCYEALGCHPGGPVAESSGDEEDVAQTAIDTDGPDTGQAATAPSAAGPAQAGAAVLRCGQRCPFDEVLSGAAPIAYREQAILGVDGVDVPVAGSYARMPGAELGAVAVLRDLRAARALDELKASFVGAVSHELRTPLALISGYAESLLHLDLDAGQQRGYVERIGHAADRLAALVDQILEISRLESDRLALKRRPVSLADIVGTLTGELAEVPGTPPVAVHVASSLPLLDVDPVRVGQVLGNLVSNATKYAGGPNARIQIRARHAGRSVVVSVVDDGPGIDPAEREHVFERFYRGQRVRESKRPGSGLGLYLCQRLVEAHGGRIWLDDRPKGTSVSLTLPIAGEGLEPPRSYGRGSVDATGAEPSLEGDEVHR